jgi:uncharacterized lipoprotein YajG
MRRIAIMGVLLLAGCAAPAVVTVSSSEQAVTAIELEYTNKFLVPAAAYSLLPRCPKPQGTPCSDPALVAKLRDTQIKLHNTIYALRDFSDASPQADASALIANTRNELAAAETMIPAKGTAP